MRARGRPRYRAVDVPRLASYTRRKKERTADNDEGVPRRRGYAGSVDMDVPGGRENGATSPYPFGRWDSGRNIAVYPRDRVEAQVMEQRTDEGQTRARPYAPETEQSYAYAGGRSGGSRVDLSDMYWARPPRPSKSYDPGVDSLGVGLGFESRIPGSSSAPVPTFSSPHFGPMRSLDLSGLSLEVRS